MYRKSFAFLVGCVVVLALGAVTIKTLLPGTAMAINTLFYQYISGWSEDACRASPSECLTSKYQTLLQVEGQLGTSIALLQSEEEHLKSVTEDQELVLAKNESFLKEGRELFQASQSKPSEPISFAGRLYPDRQTLRAQLQLLFTEKSTLARVVGQGRDLQRKLGDKREALMIERANVKAARQMIPGKLALLRANRTLAGIDDSISMIDQAIASSQEGLGDVNSLIGTTQDLITSEAATGQGGSTDPRAEQDFETFLKGAASIRP